MPTRNAIAAPITIATAIAANRYGLKCRPSVGRENVAPIAIAMPMMP